MATRMQPSVRGQERRRWEVARGRGESRELEWNSADGAGAQQAGSPQTELSWLGGPQRWVMLPVSCSVPTPSPVPDVEKAFSKYVLKKSVNALGREEGKVFPKVLFISGHWTQDSEKQVFLFSKGEGLSVKHQAWLSVIPGDTW